MATGIGAMKAGLRKEAAALGGQLVAWRRALHAMPEVGLRLPRSSAYIAEQLEGMGIAYETLVDGSCITAVLGQGGPCLMLRADFDALPVEEASGEEFAAENGCMHACGHDLHASMLLGAAKLLKAHEAELPGRVKLFFQPGEESAHGAATCIEEGILEGPAPDAAFALHVASQVPVGLFAWGEQALARNHSFDIEVTGVGGHGSMPFMCVDPITPAACIHLGLQELLAREVKASDEVALTTGAFNAGTAPNVIPQTARLKMNMRTFDDGLHDRLFARIEEISAGICAAYRVGVEVETTSDDPALICDAELSRLASRSIADVLPDARVLDGKLHVMGSEDFSYIARELPSAYFMVGARMDGDEEVFGQHHPQVRFNERCLPLGVAVHVAVAFDWLSQRA